MKTLKCLLLCTLPASGEAGAGSLNLAMDHWNYSVSGVVNNRGSQQDLEKDLGVEARRRLVYSLAWNTGPGGWPDVAASYTPINAGGQRVAQSSSSFGPLQFNQGSSTVSGDADLDDVDLSLRYPARLGRGTVWGGVTIKRIKGLITVRNQSDSQEDRQPVNQTFPLLHLAGSIPLTNWLSLSIQGNAVKYQENAAYELRAGASAGLFGPVGVNVGWQRKQYKITSGDYLVDATLSGGQIGLFVTIR